MPDEEITLYACPIGILSKRYFKLAFRDCPDNEFPNCLTNRGAQTLWRCSLEKIIELQSNSIHQLKFRIFIRHGSGPIKLISKSQLETLEEATL